MPPRVLVVAPSAQVAGGGDIWLANLLTGMTTLGVTPSMVFETPGPLEDLASRLGCPTTVLGTERVDEEQLDSLTEPLTEVMTALRPQATLFWSPRAQLYGAPAHRAADATGRTHWVQHVMPSEFWIHRAASDLPTDAVICVSHAVEAQQRRLYPSTSTRVVHPCASPLRLTSREEARRLLGQTTARPLIGVIGRVEPWKGQDVAVRMLDRLETRGMMAELALIGEATSPTWPTFGQEVAAEAASLGLADRVHFVGHTSNVDAMLPGLDAVVCSSREEGFGLAVLEAMAAGLPVIATRCGGVEDLIEDRVHGRLVDVDDPDALAEAVWETLTDESAQHRRTSAARQRARTSFTVARSAAAMLDVLLDHHLGDPDRTGS